MKQFKYYIIPLAILSLLSGCKLQRYGAGMLGNDISFMQRPAYKDHNASRIYLSGKMYNGIGHSNNLNGKSDKNFSGDFSIHRSNTFSNAYLSYGLFSFKGNYKINAFEEYYTKRCYYGFGFRGNGGIYGSSNKIEYGIGCQTAISNEYGNYKTFRFQADSIGVILNKNVTNPVLTFAIYPEFRGKIDDRTMIGVYMLLGQTLGKGNPITIFNQSMYFTRGKITVLASLQLVTVGLAGYSVSMCYGF